MTWITRTRRWLGWFEWLEWIAWLGWGPCILQVVKLWVASCKLWIELLVVSCYLLVASQELWVASNGKLTSCSLYSSQFKGSSSLGISHIFQRQWRTRLKNMKALSKVKFNSKLLKDERFGRFSKHRSMYALRRFSKLFKRWTRYEDRISDLKKSSKDDRRGHMKHHVS